MVVYGEYPFFFLSKSCIKRINICRTLNVHIKKNVKEIDDNEVGVFDDSVHGQVIKEYLPGIITDHRKDFLNWLRSVVTIVCEKNNLEYIKICLPIYLFGHCSKDGASPRKVLDDCGCGEFSQNKLDFVNVIISKE